MNYLIYGLIFVLFVFNIIIFSLYLKLNIKYKRFIKKLDGKKDIEEILCKFIDKVDILGDVNTGISNEIKYIKDNLSNIYSKCSIVKYKVYPNTSDNSCFTLVLLNSKNSGFILNSIYSSESTTLQIKEIIKGQSKETLSNMEFSALQDAILKNESNV